MCGRMNVSDHEGIASLLAQIGVTIDNRGFDPRYNIAPTSTVMTVAWEDAAVPVDMHWGLVPPWAKPGKFTTPLINARAETVWEKPSFRDAMRDRRVLIPVNGFYEWRREGKSREAFYVRPATGHGFLFGGLASVSREGELQCCIVTTDANESMQKVHHRMPVMIDPGNAEWWLRSNDVDELNAMMRPAANDAVEMTAVSSYVNNARNDGPRCMAPVETQDDLFGDG